MKRKLLFLTALAVSAFTWNAKAQDDVTSTYLTNADFSASTPIASNLKGYGKDGTPYGFQSVDGWTSTVVSGDNSNASYPNSGMGGAVFAYGSSYQVQGNSKTPPSAGPDGNSGNCLGFFAVWGLGGYYYQDVTFPAGQYTINIPVYNQSGTNATTTYFGFIPNSGTSQTIATPTTAGSWVTLTKTFTLTAETQGQIRIGYKSNGSGSGANPMLFIDKVQILYLDPLAGAKASLQAEIDKAKLCPESEGLASAIATAEGVLVSATTAEELNNALTALQAADKDPVLRYENGLSDAAATNPMTTSFVVNGTFDSNVDGWSRTGTYQNNKIASNQQGDFTGNFWENWNGSAQVNKMYQVINNIPNGTYKLKIAAFVNKFDDPNDSQYVYANDDKTYLTTTAPTFYEVWTVVTGNTIEIGLDQTEAIANWMGIDNVTLTYYGAGDVKEEAQIAGHKIDWQAAKAAAEAAQSNTDYSGVSGKERADLEAEIAKAEPDTAEGYDEATAALIAATNAFIAAKASYDELAAEIVYAASLNVPTTDAETVQADPATTAAAANAAVEALKVSEYTTLKDVYTYDAKAALGDWTSTFDLITGQHWDGTDAQYYDYWHATATDVSLSQNVTLPAGQYMFMVAGRGAVGSTLSMTANGTTANFKTKGDTGFGIDTNGDANFDATATYANNNLGRGWEWRYVTFSLDAETEVTLLVNGHVNNNWVSVTKEIYLYAVPNAELSKGVLASVIAQANGKEEYTANVGDGAFQIPASVNSDFAAAITSAQNVYDNPSATPAEVDAAVEALESAITSFSNPVVNAPAAGKRYKMVLTYAGWTYDQNAPTFVAGGRTDAGGYNVTYMPQNDAYAQNFTFTKVEGNNYTISQIDEDGNERYLTTGVPYGGNTAQIRTSTTATDAAQFTVIPTATEGVYNIRNVAANQYIGSQDKGLYTVNSHVNFNLVEASQASVDLSFTDDINYATRIFPFVPTLPSGVTAYACKSIDESKTLVLDEVTAPQANVPYILGTEGALTVEPLTGWGLGNAEKNLAAGLLTGVYADTQAPVGSYVLQYLLEKVMFYIVEEGKQPTVTPYRAYLTLPSVVVDGVKAINFPGAEDATAIEAIEALTDGTAEIYNAAGERVNRLEKGVNIIRTADGKVKKVLVK